MAGFTRQSAGEFVTGEVISASDSENEFAAIASAFDGTTGHSHDGSAGNAPKIDLATSSTGTLPISSGGTGETTESEARTALGLDIGVDVQAYDAGLASISGLSTVANQMIYSTASDTYAVTNLSNFARTILDDTTAGDMRTTLGLAIGSDVQAYDATILVDADIGSTVQAYDADTAKTDVVQSYTKQQNFGTTTLTDAASIAWDLDDNQVAKVTLGGNRTMAAPTNMVDGGTYVLRVIQDGTGSRTLAYNAVFKWPDGGTAPVLSTAASSVDILTFISDGTNMYGVAQLDFS